MPSSPDPNRSGVPSLAEVEALAALRARTPARLAVGRAGLAYRTSTQLDLREDHAAALDAVQAELDLNRDLGPALVASAGLFEVATLATSKQDYLRQPELGRQLSPAARRDLTERCLRGIDLQVVIGDGLSAAAVTAQVPILLPLLAEGAEVRGWRFGRPFVVRHCRVGILNEIGDLLDPEIVVLLIGERPGLACAESLSAYLAYRPRAGDTDARRNLISNIHARGVIARAAATRILALADHLRQAKTSGVEIKEHLPADGQQLGLGPVTPLNRLSP